MFFLVDATLCTDSHGRADGDILVYFNPDTNTIRQEFSRALCGITGHVMSKTPDAVFQDYEGSL